MTDLDALFARLSREPDFDAPELQAHDATDRLLIETALSSSCGRDSGSQDLSSAGRDPATDAQDDGGTPRLDGGVVTIGDRHGALTLGAIAALGARRVRVFQDPLLGERALAANAARLGLADRYEHRPLDASLLEGASLVLLQLPRSLAELDEIAWAVARWADPGATLLAGGRVKHMTRTMNEVLARGFGEVSAGLARRKSRVLTARAPRPAGDLPDPPFPVWGRDPELPFAVAAFGATFGGAALDRGSRLLLRGLAEGGWPEASRIVDLGCGNGVLAVSAALARPGAQILATDQSAAAVAAARLTVETAGAGVAGRIRVVRADAAEAVPPGWAELILLNPPFHSGSTVHAGVAHRLIRSCAGALAPGGELRLVFNSGLGYRPLVERTIGPTRQVARDRTFTVLSAVRR